MLTLLLGVWVNFQWLRKVGLAVFVCAPCTRMDGVNGHKRLTFTIIIDRQYCSHLIQTVVLLTCNSHPKRFIWGGHSSGTVASPPTPDIGLMVLTPYRVVLCFLAAWAAFPPLSPGADAVQRWWTHFQKHRHLWATSGQNEWKVVQICFWRLNILSQMGCVWESGRKTFLCGNAFIPLPYSPSTGKVWLRVGACVLLSQRGPTGLFLLSFPCEKSWQQLWPCSESCTLGML